MELPQHLLSISSMPARALALYELIAQEQTQVLNNTWKQDVEICHNVMDDPRMVLIIAEEYLLDGRRTYLRKKMSKEGFTQDVILTLLPKKKRQVPQQVCGTDPSKAPPVKLLRCMATQLNLPQLAEASLENLTEQDFERIGAYLYQYYRHRVTRSQIVWRFIKWLERANRQDMTSALKKHAFAD